MSDKPDGYCMQEFYRFVHKFQKLSALVRTLLIPAKIHHYFSSTDVQSVSQNSLLFHLRSQREKRAEEEPPGKPSEPRPDFLQNCCPRSKAESRYVPLVYPASVVFLMLGTCGHVLIYTAGFFLVQKRTHIFNQTLKIL